MTDCKSIFKKNFDVILFLALLIPLSVMLFARCRYGFVSSDEAFYLTIPYRLLQGDALLLHEWNLSQLIAWVLQVPVRIYFLFFKNTDGIYLSFRYIYVTLHICGSTALFLMLRKYSGIGAALSSIFYCLYAPFGIPALSYNSLGIAFLTLAAVILTCAPPHRWSIALSGLLFALSVLCCPHLAVIYVLYGAAVRRLRAAHKTHDDLPFLRPDCFFWFSVGVFATALALFVSVLPPIPFSKWPGILKGLFSDTDHQRSLYKSLRAYCRLVFKRRDVLCLLFLTVLGSVVKKKHFRSVCSIFVLLYTARTAFGIATYINYLMFPLAVSGLYFYVVYRNPIARKLFYGIWLPGVMYTLCINLASNQDFYAISSASTVPLVASVMIITVSLKQILSGEEARILKLGLVLSALLLFTLQGCLQTHLRWDPIFFDTTIADQTVEVSDGPSKGLLLSAYKSSDYLSAFESVSQLKPGGTVLLLVNRPDCYLFGDWKNGSYSAWLGGTPKPNTLDRLELYYRLNPDKLPEQVFVNSHLLKFASPFLDSGIYTLSSVTEYGDLILCRVG